MALILLIKSGKKKGVHGVAGCGGENEGEVLQTSRKTAVVQWEKVECRLIRI